MAAKSAEQNGSSTHTQSQRYLSTRGEDEGVSAIALSEALHAILIHI